MKNSRIKKPKKASVSRYEQAVLSKKIWKEKESKWQKNRQKEKDKDSAPATGVNATSTSGGKKKKKSKDLSEIVYYTCKKNGHYSNKCLKCNPKN